MNSLNIHNVVDITLGPINDSIDEENGSRCIYIKSESGNQLEIVLFGLKKDLLIDVNEVKTV